MDALIRPQPLPCLVCNQLRTFVTVDELRRVSMLDPRVKALVLDIWPSCSDAHCLRSLMKLMNKDARDRLEADPKSMTPRCYQCGFSPEGGQASMKRCSRCKIACYCSVECQRAAWPSHKKMCRPKE
ncbi:hypothetical protein DFJ74DRAFT_684072 [Hyaloraphidium curvatum]|nr:hypothetical protein DFJ74DRAFT_684072 [Hyaloraphidium curvatum]